MGNIFLPPCDEAAVLARHEETPCPESAESWILAATILGSSMAFIDGTVVNVALPALQTALNATVLDMQWVVEAYALFLAALLLVGGSIGDRYGRRMVYAIGVALFALASAWCGLSPNTGQLIVARAVQGIGGALLVPGSLAIISSSFTEGRRGHAIGTWSGFTSITTAIGPLIGGWLIDHVSWRAAFFINVPVAVIVLFIVFRHVPESRGTHNHSKLDWPGAILITLGLGTVIYGLIESSRAGFDHASIYLSLIAGALLIVSFLFYEARCADPMLPLSLFRSNNFSGANLLTLFLYAALSGALFFYPLNLIQIQGYSSTAAGASFLPFILLMFVLSRWSGGLVNRYGARLPLFIGPIVAAAGLALFALPGTNSSYWTTFFPAITILGLGMAISVAPLTTTVMSSIQQNQAGVASGINNAVSRIAGLLAVAIFGMMMLQSFNHHLDPRLRTIPLNNQEWKALDQERVKLAALEPPPHISEHAKIEIDQAVKDSFVSAFRLVMLVASGLAVASSISAGLMIRGKIVKS
jgi:EmrB/QacA subfamily drug resistance transporter